MAAVVYNFPEIMNEIRMDSSSVVWVIVEGKTDQALYKKFVNGKVCEFRFVNGKESVVDLVCKISSEVMNKKIIGIIDKDYDWLVPIQRTGLYCITDNHDIEIMMYQTNAFQYVLNEFGVNHQFPQKSLNASQICNEILNIIKNIGYLRILNKIEDWHWDFASDDDKKPRMDKVCDLDSMQYNGDSILFDCLQSMNAHLKQDKKTVLQKINMEKTKSYELKDVVQGHDFSRLLVEGLKHKWGNDTYTCKEIERTLRANYSYEDFKHTQMYITLQSFETTFGVKFLLP